MRTDIILFIIIINKAFIIDIYLKMSEEDRVGINEQSLIGNSTIDKILEANPFEHSAPQVIDTSQFKRDAL